MRKIIALCLFLLATSVWAKVNTVVSIVPQKMFVEAIGGEFVNVEMMVLAGASPHSYEPKPSQMKAIDAAHFYFTIGVEFEGAWMKKFSNQNKTMNIVDSTQGITKLEIKAHEHEGKKAHAGHEHAGLDPHVWTSPENIKVIAKNIFDTLVAHDASHKAEYTTNYTAFLAKVDATDATIKETLKDVKKGSKFMVFHPSWGYFAHQYGLEQVAIEVEGKEPKPKVLAQIMEEAKEEGVKAIFTQPEFSDKSAKQIADALKIKVIKASPLNPKWDESFIALATAIANK
jgi:zinc transport system substrate-binding protein